MRKTIWNKRIPTLLGLIVITIAIGITTFVVGQTTFFTQQASPTSNPQEIRITNISDSSFTVSYSTTASIFGSLNFGIDQKLGQIQGDEKDNGSIREHTIHSFLVKNLNPSTKYYFSIVNGNQTYMNNDLPYEVVTGPTISAKPNTSFIVGKLVTTQGTAPTEAILYATTDGAQPVSAISKPDGSYTISLENLRTQDLSSYFKFQNKAVIKMLVVSSDGTSNVRFLAKDVNQIPIIIVSKNYDFTSQNEEVASSSASTTQFPTISSGNSAITPKIVTPSINQQFTDAKPTFKGTGLPNDKITITIQSTQEIQGQVTADANGNWSFTPSAPLSPGQHTITIIAKDASGILRTISQTFTVQAALAASPSTSPTPTPTISPAPSASASPSISPSPTATPTPTPIAITTPIPSVRPTPISTLPPTGTSEVSVSIMGISLAGIGGFFLLLSKILL